MTISNKNNYYVTLLVSVAHIHILHLHSTNMHVHNILDIYNDVSDAVDELVEYDMANYNDLNLSQGSDEEIRGLMDADPKKFMENLRTYIIEGMKLYGTIPVGMTACFDNLLSIINKAIYKLNIGKNIDVDADTFTTLDFETFVSYNNELTVSNAEGI